MNITLSTVTVAVVSACFITTFTPLEAETSVSNSATSDAHIEYVVAGDREPGEDLTSIIISDLGDFNWTRALSTVDGVSQTVESEAGFSYRATRGVSETVTHEIQTSAQVASFAFDTIPATISNTVVTEAVVGISPYKLLRDQLHTFETTAEMEAQVIEHTAVATHNLGTSAEMVAILEYHSFWRHTAHWKHPSAEAPYKVTGYYNGRVVFGPLYDIAATNLINSVASQATIDMFYIQSLPHRVETTITEVPNVQIFAKDNEAETQLHTVATEFWGRDPSNVSPHRLTSVLNTVMSTVYITPVGRQELFYQEPLSNEDANDVSTVAVLELFATAPVIDKENTIISSVPNIQLRAKYNWPIITETLTTNCTLLYESDKVVNYVEQDVLTLGHTSVYYINPVNSLAHTLITAQGITAFSKSALIDNMLLEVGTHLGSIGLTKAVSLTGSVEELSTSVIEQLFKIDPVSVLHTMASEGQSDIHSEHNIIINRTETLITSLVVTLHNTPGLGEGVFHTVSTEGNSGAFSLTAILPQEVHTVSTALEAFTEEHVAPVTITLDNLAGSGGTTSIVVIDGFSITPASITAPSYTYHTFTGYYTLTDGGTQMINSVGALTGLGYGTFTSDVTLYAQYDNILYDVTWKYYSGVTVKTDTIAHDQTSYAPVGTSDNYEFDYSWPVASVTPTGDQTITETRVTKQYTITWKYYSGATAKSETINYGTTSSIGALETGDTDQYTYTWPKTSTTAGTSGVNETITETRATNQYTITWYKYGQSGETYTKRETIAYNAVSTAPAGTADTMQYDYSWPKASTTCTGNENITETRAVISYQIDWRNYAGTVVKTETLPYGSTSTAPSTTADNYEFDYSWPKASTTVIDQEIIDETRVTKQYTILWRYYDLSTAKTETINYGVTSTAPIGNTDTLAYDYNWPKASTVAGTSGVNETITETRVGQPYTVTFNANTGGTPSPLSKGVIYGNTYGTLATVAKTNWTFLGWFTAASGGTEYTSETTVTTTANHTLYAHWNPTVVETSLNTMATDAQSDIQASNNIQVSRTETTITALGDAQYFNQTVFAITLNTNGGSGGTTSITGSTGIDINPTSIAIPSWTNYTFTGYFTATSGGTKYINSNGTYNGLDSNTFVGNVTLYAQWTMSNVYFDWNPNPSTIGLKADISIGGVVQQAASSDWYQTRPANSLFKVSNLVIPTGWSYSSYGTTRLTGVIVGGSGATTEIQGSGDMSQTAARAIAVTVVGNTYNISVVTNGGSGTSANLSTYQPKTTTTVITMTRGTRTNYRFWKWTVSGANGKATVNGDTITIAATTTSIYPYGDLTITANWLTTIADGNLNTTVTALGDAQYDAVAPITITLDKQSGTSGTSSITSVAGFYLDPTSISVPYRNGYSFGGYYTGTSGTGTQRINSSGTYVALTNSTYTSNTTLYAKWTLITYTLTADKNGGTGGNTSNTYNITTSSTIATLLGSPTKTGYSLSGWKWTSGTAGGWTNGTTYSTSQNVVGKYATGTLQAQWTANSFTITLNANGGTTASNSAISVTYATSIESFTTTMRPTRTDYNFAGYYTLTAGGTQRISYSAYTALTSTTYSSATTLYAHWTPSEATGLNTVLSALGDMQTEEPTYSVTTSAGTGVTTLSVSPTTYKQNANNTQYVTITRAAHAAYDLNNATITRLGTYGGSTPTVSGTTVTIPADSYGNFRVDQTATLKQYGITEAGSYTSYFSRTPTTYSMSTSSAQTVTVTKSTITGYDWTSAAPTIVRSGTYGGTAPSQTAGDSTSATISIPANSYGDFSLNFVPVVRSFTITLNANGGTAASNSAISVTYSTSIEAFNANMIPTRSGYTFKGYYTATSGGTQRINTSSYIALTSTTYSNNTTLYAQWITNIVTTRMGCWEANNRPGDTTWRTLQFSSVPGSASDGRSAKLVLVYRSHTSGTTYQADIQLDRIRIGGVTFDFDSAEAWQKETSITSNNLIGTYATRLGAGKTAVGTSASNGYWSRDVNATGSSSTGGAIAAYGGYCLYPETSGSVLGDYWWAESPTFTYNYSTIKDIIIAMQGVSCGILAVYIIDATTTDFTPSLSSPLPYLSTNSWVYIEAVSSDPNSDVSYAGNYSGYITAAVGLEDYAPASGVPVGNTGSVYSYDTEVWYVFEVQS
jgi:uncharacterized repeat protein (TIGR02543 family)